MPDDVTTATTTTTTETTEQATAETAASAGDLDGLKRALDAERKARREADKAAKERQAELAAQKAELDRLREATASESERALIAARKAEREAADTEWQAKLTESETKRRQALIVAEIKGLAAGRFHDIGDVVMALAGHEDITVDDTDRVKGVEKALKALEEAKPHWVKQAEKTPAYGSPNTGRGGPANGRSPADEEALRRQHERRTRSWF